MQVTPVFKDRVDAGRVLATQITRFPFAAKPLVLALPRGGVPVALEVARSLRSELDVFLVRKLGLPGEEELAIGAIASGSTRVINQELVDHLHIPAETIDVIASFQREELLRREQLYRQGLAAIQPAGRTVILVDDGIATGSTMRAAVAALRLQSPSNIVIAVPIACPLTCQELRPEVDEIICAVTRDPFIAVGIWYKNFQQVTDRDVQMLLREARRRIVA